MPSIYNTEGVNFDAFFAPRGGTTARAAVGFRDADGQDIALRYMASTSSADRPTRLSHYTSQLAGGADLSTLFRRYGYVAPVWVNITSISGGGSFAPGDTVTLTVTAVGDPVITYEFRRNGTVVHTSTSPSYTFTAAVGDTGTYDCYASNDFSAAWSTTVSVVVSYPSSSPQVTGFAITPSANIHWIDVITVTLTAHDDDGDMVSYAITHVGQGTVASGAAPGGSDFTLSPTYAIPPTSPLGVPNVFEVVVTDSEGNTGMASYSIWVLP